MKPNSYTDAIKRGCKTCKHVYASEHATTTLYFCNQDQSERPENAVQRGGSITIRLSVAWFKWANPRQVEPYGRCDLYED